MTTRKLLIPLLLILALMLSACELTTKKDVANNTDGDKKEEVTDNSKVDIELLGMQQNEADMNIVRDQLSRNGFNVKLNLQPDYGTFKAQQDAGNYDIALTGWTTVTGNPDYAVRSLFTTGGDYSIMSDPEIDELVNKASTETPDQYVDTYKEFEQKLVLDKAYIAPLFISFKSQGLNKEVLKPESVRLSKSRAMAWDDMDFKDESKRDTETLVLQQTASTLTSLDPIKGNDGSINTINTNMYVRLLNLTDDDQLTTDASLSRNFAIAEGNSEYYFILRDDINFAAIKDKSVVDTGELVSAEDVVFSLNRAKDKNSVPDHRTYTLHEHIATAEIVTDIASLEGLNVSGSSENVKAALEKGLKSGISELVTDKTAVDNAAGKYQVVKVTTTKPFPQVLNYLAHQSAGIVSKKQVESINTYEVDKFDVNKDIPYGDQNTVTEGNSYNNHLYASGPYILSHKNDYEAIFYRNPGFAPGTEDAGLIQNVKVRFIKDADSTLSALRSGEIHVYYGVPENKLDIVKGDGKLELQSEPYNAVWYLIFNTKGRDVAESVDLRKAVLYSINQDEFLAFYNNNKLKAVSTVSPLVNTGLEVKADAAKAKEHLNAYKASK
ncbi:ABC transporter substrate-binding protein [Paenibacillus chungangensis]|uniref:ABC transporter substrate-binding protein n=1 Tax=Paenibacillus chungangensis TaxID=696535 RepID=A0ABW3HT65_9BACL